MVGIWVVLFFVENTGNKKNVFIEFVDLIINSFYFFKRKVMVSGFFWIFGKI